MGGSTRLARILSPRTSRVLLVVLSIVVLGLSLIPKPEEVFGGFSVYDKIGHFVAYLVLGFFALRAVGRRGPLALLVVVTCCALFGGVIEIVQPLVGRSRELADFLVDIAGSTLGAVTATLVSR